MNPSYLSAKQIEIQNKEFSTSPQVLSILNLEVILDPLAEVQSDEVVLKLTNGTITKETGIIHDNIKVFVQRAVEEDPKFAEKPLSEQREKLSEYAQEVIAANRITIDDSAIQKEEVII